MDEDRIHRNKEHRTRSRQPELAKPDARREFERAFVPAKAGNYCGRLHRARQFLHRELRAGR